MASQPVDFVSGLGRLPDPVGDAQAASANRLALQQGQMQIATAQQQLAMQRLGVQRQQQFGQAVQDHLTNPSVQSLARVFSYPEFAAQAKEISGAMDDRRRQSDLTQISAATGLAAKGDYTGAADIIDKRIAADKAAGVDSSADEHFSTALRSGDPQQQKNAFGAMTLALGAAVGPEKAGPYLEAMGLSKKPLIVGLDQRAIDTSDGRTIVGATPKLENVSRTLPGGMGTDNTAFNPYTGTYGAAATPGAAPQPSAPTGGGGPASGAAAGAVPANGSRADRNNNPGNLRAINPGTGKPVSWVTSLPGYQGADAQGYAIFAPGTAAGTAGQQALLGRYFKAGRNTVSSIVERWAPRESAGGDNTDAQVNNYTAYVARQLGVDPKQPLPPSAIPQLAAAMHQFESGATGHAGAVRVPASGAAAQAPQAAPVAAAAPSAPDPYHFGPTSGATPFVDTKGAPAGMAWNADHSGVSPVKGGPEDLSSYPPQMIHDAAVELLTTGQMPSFGMGGGAIKKAILDQRSQIMKQAGITADQLPQFRARYGADKAAYQSMVGMESGLAASQHALQANFQQVRDTQQALVKMGILGNSPDLNGAKIRWVEHFGSPEQKAALQQYRLAINASQGEYAKFMSTNTGMGNAPSTDSARAKAGEMIEEGGAVAATNGGLDQLATEAANKSAGVTARRVYLEHKLSSYLGGAGAPPSAPPPPPGKPQAPHSGGLPPGAHQIGTYQGKPVYQLPNGKKVMAR